LGRWQVELGLRLARRRLGRPHSCGSARKYHLGFGHWDF